MYPDADPDPAIFVIAFQNPNKKLFWKKEKFNYFWMYIYIIFKDKSPKKSQNTSFAWR